MHDTHTIIAKPFAKVAAMIKSAFAPMTPAAVLA